MMTQIRQVAFGMVCVGVFLASAHAQVAVGPEQLDVEYLRIKAAIAQRYDELLKAEARERATKRPDEYFDLLPPHILDPNFVAVFDCGYTKGLDFAGLGAEENAHSGSPAWAAVLFHVAKAATVVQVTARQFGYPNEIWSTQLSKYEQRGIEAAKALARKNIKNASDVEGSLPPYPDSIVESMEAFRVKTKKQSPQLVAQEGCGAGEIAVQIVTEPAARVVRIIPEFFAMVCEKTGRALAGETCPYWREAPERANFSVSGLYRYMASWADGSERSGKVDFDKLADGDDTPIFRIKK